MAGISEMSRPLYEDFHHMMAEMVHKGERGSCKAS